MIEGGQARVGWTLSVGPGRRLAGLAPLLERLAPERPDGPGRVQALGELGELLQPEPRRTRLVLDADELPLEELGFLRRALARQGEVELVLVGEDPGRRSARRLLREGRARWLSWPLDLEELEALLGPPSARAMRPEEAAGLAASGADRHAGAVDAQAPAARARDEHHDHEPELDAAATLAAIRAVLEAPTLSATELAEDEPPAWLEPVEDEWTRAGPAPRRAAPADASDGLDDEPLESARSAGELASGSGELFLQDEHALEDELALEDEPALGNELALGDKLALGDELALGDDDELEPLSPHLGRPEAELDPEPQEPEVRQHARTEPDASADDPFATAVRAPQAGGPALGLARTASEREEEEARPSSQAVRSKLAEELERGSPTVLLPRPAAPPPWFRRQIADLADLAQRLDLALEDLRAQAGPEPLEPLQGEVARLVQFTRTLGFLVAPPPPGRQRLDLAALVEELAQGLVHARADGPRCLVRRRGDATVLSDKALLATAFDAFLVLAARCSEQGDVLRLSTEVVEDEGRALVRVVIDFPEGPLAGEEPERLVEPYALRELVPDVGPNALRAATGIVSGQNGRARLARARPGRLAWTIELPAAPQ